MVSTSRPTVLTQYPRDQKCKPVTRLLFIISLWMRTALFPLRNPIIKDILNQGGTLRHIWIWSGIWCPSINCIFFCQQRSRMISPTSLRIFPYNTFLRYLGTMTTWYQHSHRTCDKLCQLCISSSSVSTSRTFPEEPVIFHAVSVKPFGVVLHWKWRFYDLIS